ncbi:GGDEF domain-containing protein [Pseudomonas sp. DTU_2021_1001937_2_SI_NGA_ILE_001]|uniref:GGDEF domain-containing protein n=1 Tax=Pseudomonas sp. DTU_2021_1001937_2_SI_NGA_ILE_001 TaxID=3077589 RepID=UPI0028FC2626|nr:GGDEF domain-containing protein [Pseudomonas sp. DTU_2021_1001937_2_SI_NGA_ILE_001]WNW13807.1 GGDEF domain-containing protein [Pseudomonas sp. DTU_2021_1001937_2_SI_NGA_ILE_001]
MNSPPRIDTVQIDTRSMQPALVGADACLTGSRPAPRRLAYRLAQQLQTSLEAERILQLFFNTLRQALPLEGLNYLHAASDLQLCIGNPVADSTCYELSHKDEALGQLTLHHGRAADTRLLAELQHLVGCLLYPLRNALLYRMALQSSLRDPLTDTGNRVAMDQVLAREADDSLRYRQPLSLLMLDIDHFKRINDTHGHANGDLVLQSIAQTLKHQLRTVDRVFRYGGEEFVVILANTCQDAAALIGERLRQAIQELDFSALGNLRPSISLGCSTLLPGESTDSLLRRADIALYVAKREGRNRMMMAG